MGDVRFESSYHKVSGAQNPLDAMRALPDEDVIAALAAASKEGDPYLANVLASEAQNRARRKDLAFRHAGEGIVAVDGGGRITLANPAAGRLLRRPRDGLVGAHARDVFSAPGAGSERCAVLTALETGAAVQRFGEAVPRAEGAAFLADCYATPIHTDGEVRGAVVMFEDVTARVEAEEALQESEARHRSLFNRVPVGLYRTTPEGEFVDANPAMARLFGYPDRASLLRSSVKALYADPADRARLREAIGREGALHGVEIRMRRRDGAPLTVRASIRAVRDGAGRVACYEGSFEDVTAEKRAAAELRESEARLQAIIDSTPAMVYVKDPAGRFTLVNARMLEVNGLAREEVLGRTDHDVFTPEDADAFRENDLRVLETGEALEFEERIAHPDGDRTFISLKVPLRDASGAVSAVCGVSTDITGRKRLETALRASEKRYAQLFDSISDGIMQIDLDRRIIACNPAFTDLTGYAPAEYAGRATRFLYARQEDYDAVGRDVRERHGDRVVRVVRFVRNDGSEFPAEMSVSYMRGDDGEVCGLIGTVRDVTEREAQRRRLEKSERQLAKLLRVTADATSVARRA